jgi:hypothetical protein
VPAQDRVRSYQQPQPLTTCFRDHAEQGHKQGPIRPGQLRTAWLPPLQDGELVAQDQDLGGLPGVITPRQPQPGGRPRRQEKDESQAHDRRSSRPGGREQLCWLESWTRFSAPTVRRPAAEVAAFELRLDGYGGPDADLDPVPAMVKEHITESVREASSSRRICASEHVPPLNSAVRWWVPCARYARGIILLTTAVGSPMTLAVPKVGVTGWRRCAGAIVSWLAVCERSLMICCDLRDWIIAMRAVLKDRQDKR